jgi:alpha-galactosidase
VNKFGLQSKKHIFKSGLFLTELIKTTNETFILLNILQPTIHMRKILLFAIVLCFNRVVAQNTATLFEGPPVFHGAQVTGNFPGTEFLFTVPATGQRPITFTAQDLPQGLAIEASTGIIRGVVKEKGSYAVKITAENAKGKAEEVLKIEIGDKLCLTPPMGWNSWNVFTNTLDEKLVIETADAMVSSGMRDLGYQYINMDDFWHAVSRAPDGKPVADPAKFPHGIKWLSDYVHSKGLKLGIYSDAGDKTCGKCFGGFQHEEIDAKVYAEWGIDLLKYDFCFVPWSKKQALERYTKMGNALKSSGRSIVYSICNWGLFGPWKWGEQVGGNYWRTTPDIIDTWSGGPFWYGSFTGILKKQTKLYKYAGPGHWNDPDMMIVGNYGQGKATGQGKWKGMTDTEYETHMSLWCMLNAPLLSGCDLRNMNEPTRNILLNPDIIAINQDAKGEQAQRISTSGGIWIYRKAMADGSVAVAIMNYSGKDKSREFVLSKLLGRQAATATVTDVWQHTTATRTGNDKLLLQFKPHQTIVLRIKAQ